MHCLYTLPLIRRIASQIIVIWSFSPLLLTCSPEKNVIMKCHIIANKAKIVDHAQWSNDHFLVTPEAARLKACVGS